MHSRYITGSNLEPQITAKLISLGYFPAVRDTTPILNLALQIIYVGSTASVIGRFADGPRIMVHDSKLKPSSWCEGQLYFLNAGVDDLVCLDNVLEEHYVRSAPKFTFTPNAQPLDAHHR
ncbi:MAG: hypothetical protein AABW82_01640 [Nanoarchaeota archaeon]